ncbi:hypothetical protein [Bacillus sp. S/N-304-OC-R1]|uniref:hypothetical protein n=1 Tax=Bacillus sp. S/N-304-OC-R1 TaxID=2758034 RepID=UPI001C8D775D|nr:hypothetical protein [Bacillus sp. S/N-304-OC-R1]MBY0124391.1 hypothetical protein [Bacillus sp. S/N-304-OC-R1]
MSKFLQQAIEEGNIRKIRSAIGTEIMSDPTGRSGEINAALRKIESNGINIWESHDGRELDMNRAVWSKEYFTKLQAQLSSNFSKERFDHTLNVGRKAYEEELLKPQLQKGEPKVTVRSSSPQQGGRTGKKGLVIGMVVVVLAIAAMYMLKD